MLTYADDKKLSADVCWRMQLRDFSKTYSFKKLSGDLLGVKIEECKFWDPLRASVRFKATMINADNKLVEVALLVPTSCLAPAFLQTSYVCVCLCVCLLVQKYKY